MTKKNLGTLVSKITLATLGVDVSPHLFRTAAASTAAAYGGNTPHLASALLNHTDPRVTEEHYNRATSIGATRIYAEIVNGLLSEARPQDVHRDDPRPNPRASEANRERTHSKGDQK